MGILSEQKSNNIFTEHGFEFTNTNANGTLKNCYEKVISLSDLYDAWIAVKTDTNKVAIYIEYECGGEVASYNFTTVKSYNEDPQGFFEEVDESVTDFTSSYKD